MESDKERALSEREHLETARAFGEAGSKVTELRTKLKSAISKSRYHRVFVYYLYKKEKNHSTFFQLFGHSVMCQ